MEQLREQLAEEAVENYAEMSPTLSADTEGESRVSITYDTDEYTAELETAASDMDRGIRRGRGPDFVNRSTPITDMDEPSVTAFVYNEAVDETDEQTVASAYAGNENDANGVDAVFVLLFSRARQRVTDDIVDGVRDPIAAFNRHTETWPHKLRARFADYEYQQGREEWPNYSDELEQFADTEGVLGMDYTQTELDAFYGDNPYENSNLSNIEARVVMTARHYDADESDISFSDISNTANFLWWLKETGGDVDEALRAHHYGTDVPTEIISQAAAPSEWAGTPLDPDNIEEAELYTAPKRLYHIVHHERGVTWVNDDGPVDTYSISDPDSRYYAPSVPDGDEVRIAAGEVGGSTASWDERIIVFDGNTVAQLDRYGRIMEQNHNRVGDLDAETLDTFDALMTGTNIGELDLVQLNPQERPDTTIEAQEGLISGMMESPASASSMFSNGPLFVTIESQFDGQHESLYFDRTNPELAREAKEALENASDAAVEATI